MKGPLCAQQDHVPRPRSVWRCSSPCQEGGVIFCQAAPTLTLLPVSRNYEQIRLAPFTAHTAANPRGKVTAGTEGGKPGVFKLLVRSKPVRADSRDEAGWPDGFCRRGGLAAIVAEDPTLHASRVEGGGALAGILVEQRLFQPWNHRLAVSGDRGNARPCTRRIFCTTRVLKSSHKHNLNLFVCLWLFIHPGINMRAILTSKS